MRRVILAGLVATFGWACSDAATPEVGDAGSPVDAASPAEDASAMGEDAGTATQPCNSQLGEADACGGDPSGTWTFLEICGNPMQVDDFIAACPEAEIISVEHTGSATVSLAPDLSYEWALNDAFVAALEFPVSCVQDVGGCEPFATLITIGSSVEMTCITAGATCECGIVGEEDELEMGIYELGQGTVTTSSSEGKIREWYYCVDDDVVQLRLTEGGVTLVFGRR